MRGSVYPLHLPKGVPTTFLVAVPSCISKDEMSLQNLQLMNTTYEASGGARYLKAKRRLATLRDRACAAFATELRCQARQRHPADAGVAKFPISKAPDPCDVSWVSKGAMELSGIS